MKDYQALLAQYDATTRHITHEWGQSAIALCNQVTKEWNALEPGQRVVIQSYKKFGIKAAVKLMNERGLSCTVVGKGPNDLRLVECVRTEAGDKELISIERKISFAVNGHEYTVDVGESVFSKGALDAGTRILLEYVLENITLDKKIVADFGAGWGAISLVLGNNVPSAQIVGFEKDPASFQAAQNNTASLNNVRIEQRDLTDEEAMASGAYTFDYVITNPPFHATTGDRAALIQSITTALKPSGKLIMVTEKAFTDRFVGSAERALKLETTQKIGEYDISLFSRQAAKPLRDRNI